MNVVFKIIIIIFIFLGFSNNVIAKEKLRYYEIYATLNTNFGIAMRYILDFKNNKYIIYQGIYSEIMHEVFFSRGIIKKMDHNDYMLIDYDNGIKQVVAIVGNKITFVRSFRAIQNKTENLRNINEGINEKDKKLLAKFSKKEKANMKINKSNFSFKYGIYDDTFLYAPSKSDPRYSIIVNKDSFEMYYEEYLLSTGKVKLDRNILYLFDDNLLYKYKFAYNDDFICSLKQLPGTSERGNCFKLRVK